MSFNNKEYVVVLFPGEDSSVAVIHRTWITRLNGELSCYWPKHNATGKAKKKRSPTYGDGKWAVCKIKIRFSSDNWEQAYNHMVQYAETSGIPTSTSDDEEPRKRKRIPTKKYADATKMIRDPSSSGEDEVTSMPNPRKRRIDSVDAIPPSGNDARRSLSLPRPQLDTSGSQLFNPAIFDGARMGTSVPLAGPPLDTSGSQLCNPAIFDGARMGTSVPLAGPPLDTSESQLQLLDNLAIPEDYPATSTFPSLLELWKGQLQLLEGQKKIMALLHEIQRNGINKITNSGPVMMEDLIGEPFQTLPQFENFDQSLKDGTITKTQIVSALKGARGAGLAETIKNMMSSIATREVWQHFSLKGQKSRTGQKRGFIHSTFYKYIRRACRYIHPGLTDPEVKIKLQVARFLTVSGSSYKSLCDKENESTRLDSNGPAQEVMGTSDSE